MHNFIGDTVTDFNSFDDLFSLGVQVIVWDKYGNIKYINTMEGMKKINSSIHSTKDIVGLNHQSIESHIQIPLTKKLAKKLKSYYDKALKGKKSHSRDFCLLNDGSIWGGSYDVYPLYEENSLKKVLGVCEVLNIEKKDIYGFVDYLIQSHMNIKKIKKILMSFTKPPFIFFSKSQIYNIIQATMYQLDATREDVIKFLKLSLGKNFSMDQLESLENKLNMPINQLYKVPFVNSQEMD